MRVGEQERGASELAGRGPPAKGDLGSKETPYLRIIVHVGVERCAERAWRERVDGDPGPGQFDGEAAGELNDGALARGIARAARSPDEAWRAGEGEDAAVSR